MEDLDYIYRMDCNLKTAANEFDPEQNTPPFQLLGAEFPVPVQA
jgi:hypothetical protein